MKSYMYSTNEEIKRIEEFAAREGYNLNINGRSKPDEYPIYFIRHVSEEDADDFIYAKSELSKKIRNIIENDLPRTEIVKEVESIIGSKPSFAYPKDDDIKSLKENSRNMIVKVMCKKCLDYVKNDEMSEEEFIRRIEAGEMTKTEGELLVRRGYAKYHEFPYTTPIANFFTADESCNAYGAGRWLADHSSDYSDKMTFLHALIYIYYRLNAEINYEDKTELYFSGKITMVLLFYKYKILSNSLNQYAFDNIEGKLKEVI